MNITSSRIENSAQALSCHHKFVHAVNSNWRGRLSTVDILIKVACFVKKVDSVAYLNQLIQAGQLYWAFPFSKGSLVHDAPQLTFHVLCTARLSVIHLNDGAPMCWVFHWFFLLFYSLNEANWLWLKVKMHSILSFSFNASTFGLCYEPFFLLHFLCVWSDGWIWTLGVRIGQGTLREVSVLLTSCLTACMTTDNFCFYL